MDHPPENRSAAFGRRVVTLAIATVLLAFLSLPVAIVFFGGGVAMIGGLIVIGLLIVCQLPAFMLLKKFGVLPREGPQDRS